MNEPVVRAESLGKTYREGGLNTRVFEGLDFAVARGETVAILGASGAGKDSLLRLCLSRLTDQRVLVAIGRRTPSVRSLAVPANDEDDIASPRSILASSRPPQTCSRWSKLFVASPAGTTIEAVRETDLELVDVRQQDPVAGRQQSRQLGARRQAEQHLTPKRQRAALKQPPQRRRHAQLAHDHIAPIHQAPRPEALVMRQL